MDGLHDTLEDDFCSQCGLNTQARKGEQDEWKKETALVIGGNKYGCMMN